MGFEVDLIRGLAVQARMGPPGIVEVQVSPDGFAGLADRAIGFEVDLLVLHRPPEALDEDVVAPGALAVHADADVPVGQHLDELPAGELGALVGVDDIRRAVAAQRLLQGLDAETGIHADRHPMGQDLAAGPVEDHAQVDEAPGHRDVGYVQGPDPVGLVDGQAAQQIGVDLVGRMLLAGLGTPVKRLDAHLPHQRGDMPPTGTEAFAAQHVPQQPGSHEGVF